MPLCALPKLPSLHIEHVVRRHNPIFLQHSSQIRQSAAFCNVEGVLVVKDAGDVVTLVDDDRDEDGFTRHIAEEVEDVAVVTVGERQSVRAL